MEGKQAVFFSCAPAMFPQEIRTALANREILLIGAREVAGRDGDRIEGAAQQPLSAFDPNALPRKAQRPIVFLCLSGMRAAEAYKMAAKAGLPLRSHMAGGINAWKQAGLPAVKGRQQKDFLRKTAMLGVNHCVRR